MQGGWNPVPQGNQPSMTNQPFIPVNQGSQGNYNSMKKPGQSGGPGMQNFDFNRIS